MYKRQVFDPDAFKLAFFESTDAARQAWAEGMGKASWDEVLADEDHLYTETPIDEYVAFEQYKGTVSDGLPRGFATMSRKVDVYSEAMLRLARAGFPYMYPYEQDPCDDYDPVCTFHEPTESPLNDEEYPCLLYTSRCV